MLGAWVDKNNLKVCTNNFEACKSGMHVTKLYMKELNAVFFKKKKQ